MAQHSQKTAGNHSSEHSQYDPKEAQERFEATLRGALKTPPHHRATKKEEAEQAPASAASAKTGQPDT